jgi:hypothetical protein
VGLYGPDCVKWTAKIGSTMRLLNDGNAIPWNMKIDIIAACVNKSSTGVKKLLSFDTLPKGIPDLPHTKCFASASFLGYYFHLRR